MAELESKKRSPYGVFMWGALLMAVVCFGLAAQRLADKRPARADIYTIAGILGLFAVAGAWSQGSAHERSRRSQEGLQGALDRLQDRMQELPRALMEDSVKVAERERQERRVDQERHAGELQHALEEGLHAGFAPLAPALSERIAASLGSLSESLRVDREERSKSLREMAGTVSGLQAFQKEWAQGSSTLLEKLREQGNALQREISERDNGWRTGLEKLFADSLTKMESAVSEISTASREVLGSQQQAFSSEWRGVQSETRAHFEKTVEALHQGLSSARESLNVVSAAAAEKIRSSADQAGAWLESLSQAATTMQAAAQEARSLGEESAASQSGFKAAVEILNHSLTGMMDRMQSLASLTQGQEALLEKMESTVRRFEDRSVELLEENALKLQETFLDVLDRIDDGAERAA